MDLDVEAAVLVLGELGLRRVDVLGHGWGAFIAVRLQATHPDMVRRMVLDNAPHPIRAGWVAEIEQVRASAADPWATDLEDLGKLGGFEPRVRDRFTTIALFASALARPEVMIDVRDTLEPDPAVRTRILEAVGDFDFRKAFERLSPPTLLVYGARSPSTTQSKMWRVELSSARSNVELVMLDDAGYLPCLEAPKAYVEAVTAFLD